MTDTNYQILKLLNKILDNMVTHADQKKFATKEDLKKFATKDDLKKFATKNDLKKFATKTDLEKFATKEDIERVEDKLDKHIEYTKGMGEVVFETSVDRVTIKEFKNTTARMDRIEEHLELEPLAA